MSAIGLLLMASASSAEQSLYATSSPSSLKSGGSVVSFTTASTTVLVTGGVGPFTYSWSTEGNVSPNSPTSETTTFRISPIVAGSIVQETPICTVTDHGDGGATAHAEVFVRHVDNRPPA